MVAVQERASPSMVRYRFNRTMNITLCVGVIGINNVQAGTRTKNQTCPISIIQKAPIRNELAARTRERPHRVRSRPPLFPVWVKSGHCANLKYTKDMNNEFNELSELEWSRLAGDLLARRASVPPGDESADTRDAKRDQKHNIQAEADHKSHVVPKTSVGKGVDTDTNKQAGHQRSDRHEAMQQPCQKTRRVKLGRRLGCASRQNDGHGQDTGNYREKPFTRLANSRCPTVDWPHIILIILENAGSVRSSDRLAAEWSITNESFARERPTRFCHRASGNSNRRSTRTDGSNRCTSEG